MSSTASTPVVDLRSRWLKLPSPRTIIIILGIFRKPFEVVNYLPLIPVLIFQNVTPKITIANYITKYPPPPPKDLLFVGGGDIVSLILLFGFTLEQILVSGFTKNSNSSTCLDLHVALDFPFK